MYFYVSAGLGIVNEFRNLILGIIGVYLTLKLDDPWIMVVIFIVSILLLVPTGWFVVHRISKVREWLTTKYGSHYQIQTFDYVKAQYEESVRIRELLEALTKNK